MKLILHFDTIVYLMLMHVVVINMILLDKSLFHVKSSIYGLENISLGTPDKLRIVILNSIFQH